MGFAAMISGDKSSSKTKETSNQATKGTQTSQLQLDEEAITRIIQETLGSTAGLASVFSQDNAAGVYNSTGSKQAAGDLVAKLVGELATITGKTVQNVDQTTTGTGTSNTSGWNLGAKIAGSYGTGSGGLS